jgi:hypothetical protein
VTTRPVLSVPTNGYAIARRLLEQGHGSYSLIAQVVSSQRGVVFISNEFGVTSTTELFVACRADAWFLDDTNFPSFYPFKAVETLPSLEDYEKGNQILCHYTAGSNRCVEKNKSEAGAKGTTSRDR